jgi:hypothetical protein
LSSGWETPVTLVVERPRKTAVVDEQFSRDEQIAIGWAVKTGSLTGRLVAERARRGEKALTGDAVVAILHEWEAAGRPTEDFHVHRTTVDFGGGASVIGVSFVVDDPYSRDRLPTFGLYLDTRWDPPWPHERVAWPDFGVPDPNELTPALQRLLVRARRGELVEIGCIGGHGRTGSALACLAVLIGTPPDAAVAWVRAAYCPDAVETDAQRAFVEHYKA